MPRRLEFYRATYGAQVRPERSKREYEDWTVRSFSFWRPVSENVLRDKLEAVALEMGYVVIREIGYEAEEVGSSESRGIGFYRWDVIDEEAHQQVARIDPDYVMRPDGSEVRWRYPRR